ncbi:hypothetical protein D3C85_1116730 [compost metagenome]
MEIRITPGMSSFGLFSGRFSGIKIRASTIATSPMGILMRKTVSQVRPNGCHSSSIPPQSCPAMEASPKVAPNKPIAFGCSMAGKITLMEESTCGASIAAASPCNIRATINTSAFAAIAQAAEVRVKRHIPMIKIRFLP